MCGILGLFLPRGHRPPEVDLGAALRCMAHRGPDGEAFYAAPDGCFQAGFCRLAIIDLETGDQPIVEPGGRRVLLGNGEIYNYVELRRDYPDYAFQTKGDMEVVLAAEARHGDGFVDRLNGIYALALYEGDTHRLTLVRDRLGVKPLYWAELAGGGIIFASEIKPLLVSGLIGAAIDEDAVNAYLAHGYVPAPNTLFRGIRKLPPAHLLHITAAGDISIERYWRPKPLADPPDNAPEWQTLLLDLLDDSVRLQLRSDVPLGALLSGGIDSGLIVALAAGRESKPINTFTVSFEGAEIDEAPLARAVAQRYATNHREITVSPDAIGDEIVKLAWLAEEPLNDPAFLPNYLIEKVLGEEVKVALNGTGGDELFAGYGRYFRLPVETNYLRLPGWLRGGLVEPLIGSISPMNAWRLSRARLFDEDRGAYLHAHSTHFPPPIRRLMGNEMPPPAPAQSAYHGEYAGGGGSAALYADMATYLPDDLLTLLDRTSMAVSVEGRVPFLDHRLVEAALSVPDQIRVPGGRQKALERAMARDLLPEPVIGAPKQGFAAPVPDWLTGGLDAPAGRALLRPQSLERGWWSAGGVETMLADPARHGFRIYSLLMLELAVRLFVEQPVKPDPPAVSLAEFTE